MLVKVVAGVHARCGVGGATVVVLCLGGVPYFFDAGSRARLLV